MKTLKWTSQNVSEGPHCPTCRTLRYSDLYAFCCPSSSIPLTTHCPPITCRLQCKFVYFVSCSVWCNRGTLAACQWLSIKHRQGNAPPAGWDAISPKTVVLPFKNIKLLKKHLKKTLTLYFITKRMWKCDFSWTLINLTISQLFSVALV